MKRVTKLPHWPPRLPVFTTWARWRILSKLLLLLVVTAILTTLLYWHLNVDQLDLRADQLKIGSRLSNNITARAHIVWEDHIATEARREEAANRIPAVYAPDQKTIIATQIYCSQLTRKVQAATTSAAIVDLIQLPPALFNIMHQWNKETWDRFRMTTRIIISRTLQKPVEVDGAEQSISRRLLEVIQAQESDPSRQQELFVFCKTTISPTFEANEDQIATLRQEARSSVLPVTQTFDAGDILIHQGTILTASDLQQLRDNRLLVTSPFARILPLVAIMLFAITALGSYLRFFVRTVYDNNKKLVLLAGLILSSLWAIVTLGTDHGYLIGLLAISAGSMAIAGLLGTPTAIVSTMLLSIAAGLTATHQYGMALITMGSSLAGIMAVTSIWPASKAIPAVLSLSLVNLILLFSLESLFPAGRYLSFWSELGSLSLDASIGAFGATFIAVGAIYMLARPFGITTHYRLMELSNPNEPLLRKMMMEAPGSYHSSVMVANIAEAAADAIGANALLTRVAALYHDIGKLKRPGFFVENQAPLGLENMHQRLSPKLSYLILTNHVKEGVEVAMDYKLPLEVINILREHHGTTLTAYFYHRAVSEAPGTPIPEHEFRYPGPKPSSKEAAIVMLSDSVQASVKSLKEPTPGRIENMVDEIVNNRLEDGQLEDCDITLRDLRRLKGVFIRILTGLYTYTRIEYPDTKGEGQRNRAYLNSEPAPAARETQITAPGG